MPGTKSSEREQTGHTTRVKYFDLFWLIAPLQVPARIVLRLHLVTLGGSKSFGNVLLAFSELPSKLLAT